MVLAVHVGCCFALTGLIWTIQWVHYPAFHYVDQQRFAVFEAFHQRSISWIVMPLMFAELLTAAVLAYGPGPLPSPILWANLGGVLAIWLSTILLSVPCHRGLSRGYDRALVRRLVLTNWPRTVLWTVRSALFMWWLSTAL